MQTMIYASSLIRGMGAQPQIDPRELELRYTGRQGLKEVVRVTAAVGVVALYAGLLAIAWQ